jgi:hypothetical protein
MSGLLGKWNAADDLLDPDHIWDGSSGVFGWVQMERLGPIAYW